MDSTENTEPARQLGEANFLRVVAFIGFILGLVSGPFLFVPYAMFAVNYLGSRFPPEARYGSLRVWDCSTALAVAGLGSSVICLLGLVGILFSVELYGPMVELLIVGFVAWLMVPLVVSTASGIWWLRHNPCKPFALGRPVDATGQAITTTPADDASGPPLWEALWKDVRRTTIWGAVILLPMCSLIVFAAVRLFGK